MKEWAKGYFRQLIKSVPDTMGVGDTLKIGMIFYDKNGKASEIMPVAEVHRDEL
jgi:hypothetical protein